MQPKRQRSPAVTVALILLALLLLGGTSLGIYHAVTFSVWHAQHSGTSQSLEGVAWSGSQFVAVGQGNTYFGAGSDSTILTSPDGRTWTAQHSSTSPYLYDVIWSGSQFVAVGLHGTILTSP